MDVSSAGELLAVENLLGHLLMANNMTCLAMSVTMNVSFDIYYSGFFVDHSLWYTVDIKKLNPRIRNCILPFLSSSYVLS